MNNYARVLDTVQINMLFTRNKMQIYNLSYYRGFIMISHENTMSYVAKTN